MDRPQCEIRIVQHRRHQRHCYHSPSLDKAARSLNVLMLYDNMKLLAKLHISIFAILT